MEQADKKTDDDIIYGILVDATMGDDMLKPAEFKDEADIIDKLKGTSKIKPKVKSVQCLHLRPKYNVCIWHISNVEPKLNYIGSMLSLKILNGVVAITSDNKLDKKDIFDMVVECNDALKKTPRIGAALHANKAFLGISSVALTHIFKMAGKPVPSSVGAIDALLEEKSQTEAQLIENGATRSNGKIIVGHGYDGPGITKKTVV